MGFLRFNLQSIQFCVWLYILEVCSTYWKSAFGFTDWTALMGFAGRGVPETAPTCKSRKRVARHGLHAELWLNPPWAAIETA